MKNTSLFRRFLSVVLVLAMVGSLLVPAASAETAKTNATTEELELIPIDPGTLESHKLGQTDANDDSDTKATYTPTDVVRVSIVLEKASTLDAGFDTKGIAKNAAAKAYRQGLRADQTAMTAKIEKALSSKLDVEWNLTLAVNIISANIRYDQMETIKAIDGVKDVFVENYFEAVREQEDADQPMNGSATGMTGSNIAWAEGYTGAGSRLAILDTGVDIEHQSFDSNALEHALRENAEAKGKSYEAYVESLNLLTAEKVEAVKDQLNANKHKDFDASVAYHGIKIPFAYNYSNHNYEATNANDQAGHHGSHVAGISAANRFIKDGEEYKAALDTVLTQGVAPDAQIIDMDVFEDTGGTWESTYMAAIEDAIILNCDSANLSLGSSAAGFGYTYNDYEAVMNKLVENDMVCAFAMGNAYMWFDYNTGANTNMYTGYLYTDDVGFLSGGSPATFTNTLAVASAQNAGQTGQVLCFGDRKVFFNESTSYGNEPIATLGTGDLEYVFFDNTGVDGDDNDLLAPYADAIAGKVVFCQRGASSFYQKVNAAWKAGAIACVIYNNDGAFIGMNLTGLDEDNHIPAVIITKPDGLAIMAQSEPVTAEDGTVSYYTGSMKVSEGMVLSVPDEYTDTVEVSDFSSYGVPGTLVMKPEILAPGGNIYSVYGALPGETEHNQYVDMSGTSMATPQVNGLAGILAQYIRENDLCTKTGLTKRQLINSLLMSTAHPVYDSNGNYWPVIRVGAGHGNVADAVSAQSYILMDENATLFPDSAKDGKVKVELGDDPKYTGEYEFSFTVYPMNEKKEFALHTDIFTQAIAGNAGYGLLQDTATMLIAADATYEVNGTTYEDVYHIEADVNMDGKTDAADAQAILDKLTGELAEDAKFDETVADIDGDGKISSYDAKLLLDSATSPVIEAAEPTKVTVHIKIDEGWKEELLQYFTKGFYVQGYTYVQPVADEEGAMDVVHSIPILGYCGSWTDPAMLDRTSVIEAAYGIGKEPYMGKTNINYMTVTDANDASYVYMGNPYTVEESFHPERLAMQSNTTIKSFAYLPIRNASEVGYALTDADGKVLDATIGEGRHAPYYGQSAGTWQLTSPNTYKVNKNLSAAGVKDGDKVTVGFYALPEYIAVAEAKLEGKISTTGVLGKEGFKSALEAGLIGDGASIKYDVTIDDTAPVVTGAMRDFVTGDFTVKAKDNNYIAYVAVMNKNATNAFAEAVPEQTEAGEEVEALLKVGGEKLPGEIVILVGDYAGNEALYRVNLGGEQEDISGSFFAFTSATSEPGKGNRMLKIEPETLTYNNTDNSYTGLSVAATTRFAVEAAEYVEGYIFMAGSDGKFYVMDARDMDEATVVGSFSDVTSEVYDMAYDVKDQLLYAMGENNTLYTVDVTTGKLTKVAEITITNPKNSASTTLKDLAIDGKGNFYSANSSIPSGTYGTFYSSETYLYTFTLDMIDGEGKIQDLAPVNNSTYGSMYIVNCAKGGSMAWDHNTDQLYVIANYRAKYATGGYNSTVDTDNALYLVDVTNGSTTLVNEAGTEVGESYNVYNTSAVLYSACSGLIIVPASTGPIKPTQKADGLTVDPTELRLLPGMKAELQASVTPWTLTDKSVTWTSNDESVVTVQNGKVSAVALGETTITVTTNAEPKLSIDVPVVVENAPAAELRGVIWDEKGVGRVSRFNSAETNAWEGITEVGEFYWGVLVDDTFYGATNNAYYAYDEDTKELTMIESVASTLTQFYPTDAAPVPEDLAGAWAPITGLGYNGQYMLLIDTDTFNPGGIDLLKFWPDYFTDDRPALMAFAGEDEGMAIYFVMTEAGELYLFGLTEDNLIVAPYGSTGIKLPSGSVANDYALGSMVYDVENNFLYVTFHAEEDDLTYLYAIDASDPSRNTVVGDFNDTVWPVIGLHEYEPATDLVLKVKPTDISMYAGTSANVEIKVKLGDTNEYTVEVEDPTVCSFEDGVITGLKEGNTNITVTTVDINDNGEHLSETISVEVLVKPYAIFDFESDAEEAGWTLVDADNDGYNWEASSGSAVHAGEGAIKSYSYKDSKALTPDNWLISPAIDLTEATAPVASFYVRNADSSYSDSFQMYAGTAADPAAMTVSLSEASITPSTEWTQYSLDLSAFAGQSEVYVAIRHYDCTDKFYLVVDDFLVTEKPAEAEPIVKPESDKLEILSLAELQARTADETAKVATGTTNAIKGELVKTAARAIADETKAEDGKVHVVLTEDEAVTNGLFTVSYDPALLTLESVDSTLLYKSIHTDAEKGVITIAYASADEIAAGAALATLDFTYTAEKIDTEITVVTTERNGNVNVEEDAVVIPVKAEKECYITQFTDIAAYPHGTDEHSAIEWAYLNKVTAGTTATTFEPEKIVSRAEAMMFLYAAKGRPEYKKPSKKFSDVGKKHWAYNAVMWAVANNITSGTSDTTFSPAKTCSRSEILMFFYAAEGKPAYTIKNPYSDVKASHWYKDAAIWAYENGLERGTNGKFKAKTDCTRLSTVLYLYRYITGNAHVE